MGPCVLPALVGPLLTFLALVSFLLRAVLLRCESPFPWRGEERGLRGGEGRGRLSAFCFRSEPQTQKEKEADAEIGRDRSPKAQKLTH